MHDDIKLSQPIDAANRPSATPTARTSPPQHSKPMHHGKKPRLNQGLKDIFSIVFLISAAFAVALVLINFVFHNYVVDGPSMEKTLQSSDRLIVLKVPRTWARITGNTYYPERGDVVVFVKRGMYEFSRSQEKQLIKRVVGLPGDRVVIKNGVVTIYNDEHPGGYQPDKEFDDAQIIQPTDGNVDITVADKHIFVLGDNRRNSSDSRSFGTVPADDIVGRLIARVFPINKAKTF